MYTHNLDPILFDFGFMAIRWYSLAYIFGILIGWWVAKKIINMKLTEQSDKKAQGYRIYAKAHEMSGKSNDEGLAIAKKKIKIGELFTKDNLTTKRPGTGISPMKWNFIIGKKASRAFDKDELIVL